MIAKRRHEVVDDDASQARFKMVTFQSHRTKDSGLLQQKEGVASRVVVTPDQWCLVRREQKRKR